MRKTMMRLRGGRLIGMLFLLAPAIGGCSTLQDELVNAFENAIRTTVDEALDSLFNQFRSDTL